MDPDFGKVDTVRKGVAPGRNGSLFPQISRITPAYNLQPMSDRKYHDTLTSD